MDSPVQRSGANPWMRRTGRSLLLPAAIAGTIATVFLLRTVRSGEGSELRRLAAAVGPYRMTGARFTGGFAYAPCDTAVPNAGVVSGMTCRVQQPAGTARTRELSKLAATIRAASETRRNSAAHRRLAAAWHIVWDDADAAVADLQAAARIAPADGRVLNDLAAALLTRAQRVQDPRLILDAFNAVDSALVLLPRQPEARFNRALILEWLGLRNDALAAWGAFLEVDARSPWADEARAHLRQLRGSRTPWLAVRDSFRRAVASRNGDLVARIANQYPAGVRREARRAMVDWAHADGRSEVERADTLLASALTVARGLASATGDSLWLDAAAAVAPARRSDGVRRHAVALGIAALDRGEGYLGRFALDSAEAYFNQSLRTLTAMGNAARYLAAFGLASVAYSRQTSPEYQHALSILRSLRVGAPNAYRVVRGQAARTEGVILGIQANFGAAIAAYSTAILEGRGTGDPGLELRPYANLAANYASLGDDREAWLRLCEALRSTTRYPEANDDVQRILARSADLSARRAPRLALRFQREGTRVASRLNASAADSLVMVAALRREAELLGGQGLGRDALETVRKARGYLASVESDSIRAVSTADLDLVEGQALLTVRPDSAVRVLQRVVDRYQNTSYFRQVSRAELLLANAYMRSGAMDRAQGAFEAALVEVERRRSNITGPEERARFLDQARPVIDTLVWLLANRGDTLKALAFLEQMRSRVLLERVRQDSASEPVRYDGFAAVRGALPATTTVVSYAVLKDEVIAWVIRRDRVQMFRTPTGVDVQRLTSRFSTLVSSQSAGAETKAIAEELYRLLITPLARSIDRNGRLVVVPDKWLQFIPFAALVDPTSGQFLVQQFETSVAPSLELYAQSVTRYDQLERGPPGSVLTVGNPSFDTRVFSLPLLPGAEREAKRVAASYERAQLLIGRQATKEAVMGAAVGSSVIHFAGHGVVRPDAPLLSYLLLSPDSGEGDGRLTARELFNRELPLTRLAILSGCQTASGHLSETEGVSSLARALFAAGVPAVVASLWSVNDEDTADFFADYHQILSRGGDPSASLRSAQLHWVEKKGWNGAATWAAFTLFGSTGTRAQNGVRSTETREAGRTNPHR